MISACHSMCVVYEPCSSYVSQKQASPSPSPSPSPIVPLEEDPVLLDRQELASLLKKRPSLSNRQSIHANVVNSGLLNDTYLGNLLIGMYRDCGALEDARLVFDRMQERSVVSWTVMMAAYCDHGHGHDALHLFHHMQQHGIQPNHITFITILNACTDESALADGKMIHASIMNGGFECDVVVATALVNMYGRCGDAHNARTVFDQIKHPDLVLWSTMIAAYSQCGLGKEALKLFRKMQLEGVKPNQVTFISALSACTSPSDLEDGKFIHACISNLGFASDVVVGTSLVNMYGKCGAPNLARASYDNIHHHDVISWTAMIVAYSSHGHGNEAFDLFKKLRGSFEPNQVTFISVLGACVELAQGRAVNRYIIENGFDSDVVVGTALVNMYGRCGSIEDSWLVFNKIQPCDVVCWNSMVAAYSQHGHSSQALQLFQEMQQGGVEPDQLTYNSLLCACASPAALADGKWIHASIKAKGFESDIIVANALVNMYAKCGAWADACSVFERMDQHNLFSWNAIIAGCCQHGHAKDALQLLKAMQQEGIEPDEVTFLCLLNACSHAGLVDECYSCFLSMVGNASLRPRLEHLTCIVGLLGRSGRLEDAENLIRKTTFRPDSVVWLTLLGACRTHGDMERAERIADTIFKLDPYHEAAYVLLANMYSAVGRWDDVEKVEEMMLARGIKVTKS